MGDFKLPSKEEIIDLIDSLTDVSQEEKERMKKEVLEGSKPKVPEPVKEILTPELIFVFILFLALAVLIGAIAVKLIHREKERRNKIRKRESGKKVAAAKKKTGKSK